MRTRSAILAAAVMASTCGTAAAQLAGGSADPLTGRTVPSAPPPFSIGAGAAILPDYEGSDDYTLLPALSVRAAGFAGDETFVNINGLRLRSNLLPDEHWRLGVIGGYLDDYDDVDDSRVQDLRGVDKAVLFGLTAAYDFLAGWTNDLLVEVDAQYDIWEGNGGTVTPRFSYSRMFPGFILAEVSVSTTWASQDYMSERFGISGDDASRSGLDAYDADDGFKDVGLSLNVTVPLSESFSVTGFGAYSRLLGDAADSPIVDDRGDEGQLVGGVLLNYSF